MTFDIWVGVRIDNNAQWGDIIHMIPSEWITDDWEIIESAPVKMYRNDEGFKGFGIPVFHSVIGSDDESEKLRLVELHSKVESAKLRLAALFDAWGVDLPVAAWYHGGLATS